MNYKLTVGLEEGERDGPFDGDVVGSKTGMFSSTIGDPVGTFVGLDEGERDGSFDGETDGTLLGLFEGDSSGSDVGCSDDQCEKRGSRVVLCEFGILFEFAQM